MPFDNVIARGDAPQREESIDVVLDGLENTSASRTLFRQVTVGKNQVKFRVLSALPMAYWVNGDTGLKQTTELAWANKFINIEELAVIVPIPQNVVDDSDYDIWAEARPKVAEAIDRQLDLAVFFGVGAPASFPTDVFAAATAAGNATTEGEYTAAEGGVFASLDDVIGDLEDDGFQESGWVANRRLKGRFRRARNNQGDRLDRDRVDAGFNTFDGAPVVYTMDGLWPAADVDSPGPIAFAGDWQRQFILALRKDVTYEVFREGVIQDNTGAIVYNLLQQDMVALRVTFRAGWQVANTINYAAQNEAQRYPAAVLQTAPTA